MEKGGSIVLLILVLISTSWSQSLTVSNNPFEVFGGEAGCGSENTGNLNCVFSRDILHYPEIENQTNEVGNVMVELIVDREGNVNAVKVLELHGLTTTNSVELLASAEKYGWEFKFSQEKEGPEKQKIFKLVQFTITQ